MAELPPRSTVAKAHTWNSESVFPSHEAWAAELEQVKTALSAFQQKYQNHLADSPQMLAEFFDDSADLNGRIGKIYVYASIFSSVDTGDQQATAMSGQARSLYAQMLAAVAFANPEMLVIGQDTLNQWMKTEPRLAIYAHYVEDLFRQQAHVRSAEVEEILGLVADPFGNVSSTAGKLTNADLKFQPARSSTGEELSVEQGTVDTLYQSSDRTVRQTAWESYCAGHYAFKNTLASNLITAVKQDVFTARVRHHESALSAALFPYNIPTDVFYNLIDTFKKNLPTWHRYWRIKRQALGYETLHPYDIWAPLTQGKIDVEYTQAVDWISEGLRPLGDDYVSIMRRGCLEDRWVDIYPNKGKRQGAFSSGWKGTHPFIVMSYDNTLIRLSTLAHELGHSMHSYLTWQTQPMIYSDYSLFVAEVASNFHQAMTRAYLLDHNTDPNFQIGLIEEAMSNFHRYFFIMPTLARFELEMHERVERGAGVTADQMVDLMYDLFNEGYGGELQATREETGIVWAQFGHLYANFYVFQYATGISAAHALAQGILDGKPNAATNYRKFLSAGSSLYPLDALKLGGVDMTTPDAVEKTFAIMADYVDRLEQLTQK
jgi:oligoendopeptidase F